MAAQPVVDNNVVGAVRDALVSNALPGELDGFTAEEREEAASFVVEVARELREIQACVSTKANERDLARRTTDRNENRCLPRAAMTLAELPTNQEFALVVTRRNAAGVHEVVALVSDDAMLDRALRKAAS